MNYTKQFAEMLGVEVGEKFNVLYSNGNVTEYSPYKIDEGRGIIDKGDVPVLGCVYDWILTGEYIVQRLPWKPKDNEPYWWVSSFGDVCRSLFQKDDQVCLYRYEFGNVFSSKARAQQNKEIALNELNKIKEKLK